MSFQPLGYRFDIVGRMSRADAKAAIRARLKGWFDPKSGPRGWMIGPVLCLWMSAFDRQGPMLLAWVSQEHMGCSITGRAGSDLNGVAAFLFISIVALALVAFAVSQGHENAGLLAAIVPIILLCTPLMLWMNHADRRHADPLVRFLRNIVAPTGTSAKSRLSQVPVEKVLTLLVNGEEIGEPVSPSAIYDALSYLTEHEHLVLQSDDQRYIQAARSGCDFILEKRDGSHRDHFRAVRAAVPDAKSSGIICFDDVVAALTAYASDTPFPVSLRWEHMDMPPP